MCTDYRVMSDSLLPVSGGWNCGSVQGFLVLMAHARMDGSRQETGKAREQTTPGCAALAVEVAEAFRNETGRDTSALALTADVDEQLALTRFLAQGGSSAAVLLMDAEVLGSVWPPCDWQTPLLRVRNRLADESSKFFVALTTSVQKSGMSAALGRARAQFVAKRVERFCNHEGMGYLDFVSTAPQLASSTVANPLHERVAAGIAHKLASARFFCCDAFRIGSSTGRNLSQIRG